MRRGNRGNLSMQHLRKNSEVKNCENIKWKRQMQYGQERGQSEPAGTCEKQRYCSFSLSTAAGRG